MVLIESCRKPVVNFFKINSKVNWNPFSVGYSNEGRAIPVYLSAPRQPEQPVDSLIIGGFHGDEPESVTLAQRLMRSLKVREASQKIVAVIPLLNPDGLIRGQRGNANNVDINRNFPEAWADLQTIRQVKGLKSAPETYNPGPAPASEPETRFLIDMIHQLKPRKIVTVHQPYRVVNYDGPAQRLASEMAKRNKYPVKPSIGYPTPGSFGTYAGIKHRIPTITLELPDGKLGWREIRRNIKALKAAITVDDP